MLLPLTTLVAWFAAAVAATFSPPAGSPRADWEAAVARAGLELAPPGAPATAELRTEGGWTLVVRLPDGRVERVPVRAPRGEPEREDIAALAASLTRPVPDGGEWALPGVVSGPPKGVAGGRVRGTPPAPASAARIPPDEAPPSGERGVRPVPRESGDGEPPSLRSPPPGAGGEPAVSGSVADGRVGGPPPEPTPVAARIPANDAPPSGEGEPIRPAARESGGPQSGPGAGGPSTATDGGGEPPSLRSPPPEAGGEPAVRGRVAEGRVSGPPAEPTVHPWLDLTVAASYRPDATWTPALTLRGGAAFGPLLIGVGVAGEAPRTLVELDASADTLEATAVAGAIAPTSFDLRATAELGVARRGFSLDGATRTAIVPVAAVGLSGGARLGGFVFGPRVRASWDLAEVTLGVDGEPVLAVPSLRVDLGLAVLWAPR